MSLIKHGFRIAAWPQSSQIGTPLVDGSRPASEKFYYLGSEFRSCFFSLEFLGWKKQFKTKRVVARAEAVSRTEAYPAIVVNVFAGSCLMSNAFTPNRSQIVRNTSMVN